LREVARKKPSGLEPKKNRHHSVHWRSSEARGVLLWEKKKESTDERTENAIEKITVTPSAAIPRGKAWPTRIIAIC